MIAQAAYQLLARWGTGRRVVIVDPVTVEGPRLCAASAKQVFVISNSLMPEPGLDVRAAKRRLPLRDASVEIVMFPSPALTLVGSSCAIQLADAARVLSSGGLVGIALGEGLSGHDLEHIRKCLGEPFRELRCAVDGDQPVMLLGSWTAPIQGIHSDPSVRPIETLDASFAERAVSANLGRELHPADVLVDRQRLRQELAKRTASLREAEAKQSEAEEELRRERLENVRLVAEIERMREERERHRVFEQQRAHKLEQLGAELSQIEREHAELKAAAGAREQQHVAAPTSEDVERARARERSAQAQAQRSEQAVAQLTHQLAQSRRALDEASSRVAKLRAELDVVKIQLQQAREHAQVTQAALAEREQAVSVQESAVQGLRRQLELLAGEYQHARHGLDQRGIRIAELEAKVANTDTTPVESEDAWTPVRRLALEGRVRAEEQEYLLIQLDKAEQRIWEMVDASDRSAARLAAGLAQLEKQKEQYDELLDELEVNRGLLATTRTRVNDLERILAVEHAKLARAGIEVEPVPAALTAVTRVSSVGDSILDALVDDDEDGVIALAERPEDTPNYAEVASHVVSRDALSELEHYELDQELLTILDVDSGMYKVGSPGLGELLREHDEAPRVQVELSADLEKALDLLDEDDPTLSGLVDS